MALVIFSGVAVPRPAQQVGMQHDVGLASQAKEWMRIMLEVQKYFMPGSQVDERSCNQIICNLIRQSKF